MRFITLASATVLLLTLSMLSLADRYIPEHLCFKPEKPLFMATAFHDDLYKQDVNTYKFCIRDFIRDQEQAIIIHQEAIKKATSDWNEFVEEDS